MYGNHWAWTVRKIARTLGWRRGVAGSDWCPQHTPQEATR
jgi:hypothetical protein